MLVIIVVLIVDRSCALLFNSCQGDSIDSDNYVSIVDHFFGQIYQRWV